MQYKIPVMADLVAEGKTADVLFWIGCAGSFDQRAQRITIAFAKILNQLNINFAVLGTEEACTGDPARRAGAGCQDPARPAAPGSGWSR